MSHGRSLPDYLRFYLQREIRALLAKEGSTGEELARVMGITGAQVSGIKSHGRGAGWKAVDGLATALGIPLEELIARARASQTESPPSTALRVVRDDDAMANGEMDGWAQAEAEARKQSNLPNWTFVKARRRTGLLPKDGVTPQYVIDEAIEVLRYASPDESTENTTAEYNRKLTASRNLKRKRKSPSK
jgi:transcriptional regulator with XRE-family HTH domain